MDRFESMSVFVAVVEAGSLSAAARRLGMPLATVSRKVAELEEGLSAQLLVRSQRGVVPTDIGRAYVDGSRRLLDDLRDLEQQATGAFGEPRGHLVVSAPVALGRLHLAPVVLDFLAAYSEVDVELRLSDRFVDLVDDQVDVALRVGRLADSALVATRVGEVRRVACASPAYLARRGRPDHPRALIGHACITLVPLERPDSWSFVIGKRSLRFPVRSRLSITTAEAAVDAAVSGLGIAHLFSYQVAAAVEARRLELLLQAFEPAPSPVQFVHLGGRRLPQKLRAFLDFAAPRLKGRLASGV